MSTSAYAPEEIKVRKERSNRISSYASYSYLAIVCKKAFSLTPN